MTASNWNRSYIAPFTHSGVSQMVTQPPWHYAGWNLSVDFEYESVETAKGLVAPGAGKLNGLGSFSFSFIQWAHTGEEMFDPITSQFQETSLLLQVERDNGEIMNYSPGVWANQDASVVRGLLQGLPKKWGNTHLTLSVPISSDNPAASPIEVGSKIGASLAVKDRRLVEATGELTGRESERLGFMARPTLGAVAWPDLRNPNQLPAPYLVRSNVIDVVGTFNEVNANLTLFPHQHEELELLGEVRSTRASYGVMGYTITGAVDA